MVQLFWHAVSPLLLQTLWFYVLHGIKHIGRSNGSSAKWLRGPRTRTTSPVRSESWTNAEPPRPPGSRSTVRIRGISSFQNNDPLYIVDGDDTLVESSTFVTDFEACPSTDFPKTFEPGDKVKRCLVYLAPDKGDLVAVSFRPTEEFDPIIWVGELTTPEPPKDDKSKKGDKKKGDKMRLVAVGTVAELPGEEIAKLTGWKR